MIALFLKESQALLAYWAAFALLGAGTILLTPLDAGALAETQSQTLADWGVEITLVLVLSLMVGHGVVASELREGHIEFLDGLPVARWQVYATKVLASLAPCLFLVVVSLGADLAVLLSSSPPHGASPLQPLLLAHLVMLAATLGGLGIGLLISWLGPLAWGLLGLSLLVAGCAGILHPPLRVWVPLVGSLGTIDYEGTTATHPVAPLVGLLLAGFVSTLLSGLLFLGPGQALVSRGSRLVALVRVGMGGCLGLLLVPLAMLTGVGLLISHGARMWQGVRVVESQHFRVLYAPGNEVEAQDVARTVDALSAEVGHLVGHDEPIEIDLELLDTPANHLGAFTGAKIRYLGGRDTLAHELAHAHARALAGEALVTQAHATQFFNEGLADWVEAQLSGRATVSDIAGAIWRVSHPELEVIVDRDRLSERHDPRVAYELGQAFVAALVEEAGPQAPGCLLRELRGVGDERVAALALWYGLSARCGIDLDAVREGWVRQLEEAGRSLPPTLPRLRARVDHETGELFVRDEAELGWRLSCGFRDDETTEPAHQVWSGATDGRCPIPYGRLSGSRFQYTIGFVVPGDARQEALDLRTVYLPWAEARR
jgi:hypothetical protein